eukprot:m.189953 g.189953  ORF g.189953 m.189953 type:complete len:938 (-) comp25680_c0_seq1:211-3024(-)
MSAPPPGQTENLAELENLNEETLLNELGVRFKKDIIYTYVGEILVSMNPFKWIKGIYDQSVQNKYTNIGDRKSLPPHLFATADLCFQNMTNNSENQVVVISGESGAGKTEAAKLFVKHLIHDSVGVEFEGLEQKLIQVNPLLEAFGNAKTGMNNNSSRFGKFIDLRFNSSGAIKGAVMREYLLEKSRVVAQSENEQNFHVFYLFFSSLTPERKEKFELGDPSDYRYLMDNDEALDKIASGGFNDMNKELLECMGIVGFSPEQQDDLFSLLSGILHLGDVEFDGDDGARIVSEAGLLTKVCNQLSIDETALELALTRSVNIIRGEETERAYTVEQADDCRDAAAKALYGRAFSWIVEQCNKLLGPKEAKPLRTDKSVGILDIFGFEQFDHNSFEQLCINLANEQLQFFFNNHIFKMELDEYAKEGITGKNITYEDNQPLLDLLLQNKPLGLLAILDEEANFPRSTDSTMIQKFHGAFTQHKDYERPRGNEDIFTLSHYAGKVKYEGEGFLEKNRDTLAVDVIGAFRLSENALVAKLFGSDEEDKKSGRKKGPRKKLDRGLSKKNMRMSMKKARASLAKKKKVTVASFFKSSLAELMVQLNAAAPHFIRCIKPNVEKEADLYTNDLVTKQLRYTGMLETTRIRREGYASRPTFSDFIKRYQGIGYYWSASVTPNENACRKILEKSGITGYEIGKTKVFLRYWHADELNERLRPIYGAAVMIQKYGRGFTARSKYKKLLQEKREMEQKVDLFISGCERNVQGVRDVILALCDEDDVRPKDFFTKKDAPPLAERQYKKEAGGTERKKKMQRAASVKWFKEVEKKKGAGQTGAGFAEWFHGIITRKDAESLLRGQETGTFLVRVAESRFGYSLSLMFNGRCKHFMIDQDKSGAYVVVGNDRTFPSLNEVVAFHGRHPVTADGDLCLHSCSGKGDRHDLKELE